VIIRSGFMTRQKPSSPSYPDRTLGAGARRFGGDPISAPETGDLAAQELVGADRRKTIAWSDT
jgi:hypothetical protein